VKQQPKLIQRTCPVPMTTRLPHHSFCFLQKKKLKNQVHAASSAKGWRGPGARASAAGGGRRPATYPVPKQVSASSHLFRFHLLVLCCHRLCCFCALHLFNCFIISQRSFPVADGTDFSVFTKQIRVFFYIYVYYLIEQKRENEKGLPFFSV
jgi:hypothetical protein